MYMYYSGAFHAAAYVNSAVMTAGKWIHVCLTYPSAGTPLLYINGSTTGTTLVNTGAPITYSSNVFSIGYDSGGSKQQLNGAMAEIFLYNRALSSTEVGQLYAGGAF